MHDREQRLRKKLAESGVEAADAKLVAKIRALDKKHARRVSAIFDELGRWPGRSLVGREGSQATFVLVQHADFDVELQKRAVNLLVEAVENGEASPKPVAYLTDRVRLKEGKKQLFGTQAEIEDGSVRIKPVLEPEGLAERRRQMGLVPMDEYIEHLEKAYRVEESAETGE